MKTKAWGAVVMVAMAWILWAHSSISGWGIDEWEADEGFESKAKCVKALTTLVDKAVVRKGIERVGPSAWSMNVHDPLNKGYVRLRCFPQNFDPRK
jgi:hypothetical protein